MRGNVPDLDLPTPAEMRDTDGVDLTDLNHKLTHAYSHLFTVKPAANFVLFIVYVQVCGFIIFHQLRGKPRNSESDLISY